MDTEEAGYREKKSDSRGNDLLLLTLGPQLFFLSRTGSKQLLL